MRSRFAIAGHPLHPALIALPIGLFVWAFVADIIYLTSDRNEMWYDISYWTSIAGVVTALIAALPGFGDYFTMASKSDARDMATAHMVLNLIVVAMFAVSVALMFDHGATDGAQLTFTVALHALANGLLVLSGWLGGEMAYRYHLGMIPDDPELEAGEHRRHEGTRPRTRPMFRGR